MQILQSSYSLDELQGGVLQFIFSVLFGMGSVKYLKVEKKCEAAGKHETVMKNSTR